MVDLLYLDLSNNLIQEVGPLSGLLRIQWLYLSGNRIADVAKLNFFPALQITDLRFNPIANDKGKMEEFGKRMPKVTILF